MNVNLLTKLSLLTLTCTLQQYNYQVPFSTAALILWYREFMVDDELAISFYDDPRNYMSGFYEDSSYDQAEQSVRAKRKF